MATSIHDDPVLQFRATTLAEVMRRLNDSKYAALRYRLSCDFEDGVLTLRGNVPSFFLKQIAQTIAASVADVTLVSNHLKVISDTYSIRRAAGF